MEELLFMQKKIIALFNTSNYHEKSGELLKDFR